MIKTAISRRVSTAILALGLAIFGALNLNMLPVDFLPSVKYPLIKLSIVWPGATPEDIDRNLADPIERQLSSVDGLDFLSSSSMEGLYQLDVNYRYGVDIDVAYQDTLAAFARSSKDLPPDIEAPVIIKADPSQLPIVQAVFASESMSLTELRTWIDSWLTQRLLAAGGVAAVDVAGGLKREIRILVDTDKLERHGLSLDVVERRLKEENLQRVGGRVTGGQRETIVRTMGEFTGMEAIRDLVLVRGEGEARVRLRDVAQVEDSHEEVRLITRLNGKPAVKVNIIKQADANTVQTVRNVERRLAELAPSFPADIRYTLVENQADYINDSIKGVRNTALEALALVVLVLFLFLGNPRQVLIIAIALPFALLVNFFLMRLAGFSLNIFSLGGLVVAIGVLPDASIIVVENITRLRGLLKEGTSCSIAETATREVGGAILAATITFIALFSPFLLVPGLITLLFRELVLVVLGLMVIAGVGAITLTPMLGGLILRGGHNENSWSERMNRGLQAGYGWLLRHALRFRIVTVGVFIGLAVIGVFLFQKAGAEFFPAVDDGRIVVKVRMPAGAALGRMDEINKQVEALVLGDERVRSVFTLTGGAVRGLYTNKIGNEGEVDIELVPPSKRDLTTTEFIKELRPKVAKLHAPGATLAVNQAKMRGIRSLGQADIEVEINGSDIDSLFTLANDVAGRLKQRPELINVYISLDSSKPEWQVDIDRTKAAEYGLSVAAIASSLHGYIGGDVPTRYREASDLYDIRVIVPEQRLRSRSDVENLIITTPSGGYVRLRDVAQVHPATGPVEIIRKNQVKQVIVRCDPAGTDLNTGKAAVTSVLSEIAWPTGYGYSLGGKALQMAEMQGVVKSILGYALFFSFIVLAVQFNNMRLPLVILFAAPFCLTGLGYGLWLGGQPFGATVIIAAMIVLAANVIDGVLLIETAEHQRKDGVPLMEATLHAGLSRLRPRLMTVLPAVLGFTPLAFALEEGGELLRPMAAAAIGGLLLNVFVALFLVPVLYTFLASRQSSSVPEADDSVR
ncbi:cation transporter [Thermodesulfomicrobium sp. WS]|uniref:efflux RND transporter permease subunit n=1 Tax=Thermodesulfomicrobium sp. WS TaxID=3004129 RepID=UPI00249393C8|nr:efflux RND transporter permease subunit [Thermodesulfomicrobium sp. WS]BDV01881.1 cation transporter [Thermodesulfomicrobium sp. WS]